jgi:hypothetical protein
MIQYSQDYDERNVPRTVGSGGNADSATWANITQPYIKSTQIFQCPSDSAREFNTWWMGNLPAAQQFHISYLYNTAVARSSDAAMQAPQQYRVGDGWRNLRHIGQSGRLVKFTQTHSVSDRPILRRSRYG